MSRVNIKKDGYLVNDVYGYVIDEIHSDNDKCYAVIAECGHCRKEYRIIIMFTQKCKDLKTAIEMTKSTPMVRRDKKNCIIDAFEITPFEKFCIDAINDHDEYLRGYLLKDTEEMLERRVLCEEMLPRVNDDAGRYLQVKTAEQYNKNYVLERYFSPFYQGEKLVFPQKVNRKDLVHDFIQRGCIRYGMLRNHYYFLALYYQLYGEDNDLRIEKRGNYFYYKKYDEIVACEIPENMLHQIETKMQVMPKEEKQPTDEFVSARPIERKSQTEKFYERMKKHQEMINSNQGEPERE